MYATKTFFALALTVGLASSALAQSSEDGLDPYYDQEGNPLSIKSVQEGVLTEQTQATASLGIGIKVINTYTRKPIIQGSTLRARTPFQVTVTTNGVNCAGQFVVTALGAPGAPPSVLVQSVPFIIGPAVNRNSVTGTTLTSNVKPDGFNDWKITASCNGAKPSERSFAFFEFFVRIP